MLEVLRKTRFASYRRSLSVALQNARAKFRHAEMSMFHDFMEPPWGGANQFLLALWNELESRGLRLENNTISPTTRVCLYNSYNFDFERLRKAYHRRCKMVHRVDGPLSVYRGTDDGSDKQIWKINQEMADATIFQSNFSLNKHRELGMQFISPHVIPNAPDPSIFHPRGRTEFSSTRKIRLISVSWSDNPNKGFQAYRYLESNLDWNRYEYTFVGRAPFNLGRIQILQPVPSGPLSDLLRQHDIYITASQHDPCSNSLLEALACGLPSIYLNSGGHPEIVGEAGFSFTKDEEIPDLLDQLVLEYHDKTARISIPSLPEVADRYLAILGIGNSKIDQL